jgi:redox-sensitive transcriptional activator SoxR
VGPLLRRADRVLRDRARILQHPGGLRGLEETSQALAASGPWTPLVGRPYALADAAGAHRALESRATVGKTVLVPMTTVSWQDRELTLGQLAARAGVAVSALHFYEARGLIRARRTAGNQRRYPRDTLRRIVFIRVARRVGIPLATIQTALASLPSERSPTAADRARLSATWRSELDDRITRLT